MPEAASVTTLAVLAREIEGEDSADRRQALANALTQAPEADLLVLPYLAAHPPFWRDLDRQAGFRHAERSPYPSLVEAQHAAKDRKTSLLASAYEALGEGVFYALAQVSDSNGEVRCIYRQWHALNQPGMHERLYLQPGSGDKPPIFECAGLRLGLLMGGDLWVPEMARLLRLAGAETLIALTAIPAGRAEERRTLAAARSFENGVPVILANRGEPPDAFGVGSSLRDDRDDTGWQVVEIDRDIVRARRRRDDPVMMRRPRLYAPLTGRWEEK